MVVFPVIQLEGKDTFTIAQNRLAIKVNVGQFLDEKLDEGIMVYNMDLMGSKLHLRYKRVAFNYTIYGDLTNAIGLRVDDLHAFSFRHYAHGDSGYAGVSLVTAAPPYSAKKHHSYLNVFAGKTSSGGLSLYGQLSYLLFSPDGLSVSRSLTRQLAAVAGVTIRHSSPKFSLTNSTELRYYGMTYNLFHSDVQLRYRKPATDAYTMYANTVGKYLYPLRKFDTPFSQWAVFTEYIGNNLFAAAVTGTIDYAMTGKLAAVIDYDLNFIHARLDHAFSPPARGSTSFFVYPFFKCAARYSLFNTSSVSLFLSNKAMNLDAGYPTLYLLKKPFMGLEFNLKI